MPHIKQSDRLTPLETDPRAKTRNLSEAIKWSLNHLYAFHPMCSSK
jgi:hypothetical protein